MNKGRIIRITTFALCAVFIAGTLGCGGGSKRHVRFQNKPSRDNRGRYVVRGQLHKNPSAADKKAFIWPVDKGIVMSGFGIRRGRRHDGIDVSAKGGTPVLASADGKIVFNGRMRGYGNLIVMKHDNDYFTAYAHNSSNLAKKGATVKQGEKIALVGRTGRATGNHVHFEIRKGQKAMNPMNFMPARAGVIVRKKVKSSTTTVAAKTKTGSKKRGAVASKKKRAGMTVAKNSATAEKAAPGQSQEINGQEDCRSCGQEGNSDRGQEITADRDD